MGEASQYRQLHQALDRSVGDSSEQTKKDDEVGRRAEEEKQSRRVDSQASTAINMQVSMHSRSDARMRGQNNIFEKKKKR